MFKSEKYTVAFFSLFKHFTVSVNLHRLNDRRSVIQLDSVGADCLLVLLQGPAVAVRPAWTFTASPSEAGTPAHSITLCLELISCFVPEALPLNHSLQSHCASPESERGHGGAGTEQESVNIKEMWSRENERGLSYSFFFLFCMSVFQSLQRKSSSTVFVVE